MIREVPPTSNQRFARHAEFNESFDVVSVQYFYFDEGEGRLHPLVCWAGSKQQQQKRFNVT